MDLKKTNRCKCSFDKKYHPQLRVLSKPNVLLSTSAPINQWHHNETGENADLVLVRRGLFGGISLHDLRIATLQRSSPCRWNVMHEALTFGGPDFWSPRTFLCTFMDPKQDWLETLYWWFNYDSDHQHHHHHHHHHHGDRFFLRDMQWQDKCKSPRTVMEEQQAPWA